MITDEQVSILADDAVVVTWWCLRMKMKRPEWKGQVAKAIRLRLDEFAGGPKVEDIVRERLA